MIKNCVAMFYHEEISKTVMVRALLFTLLPRKASTANGLDRKNEIRMSASSEKVEKKMQRHDFRRF